MFVFQVIEGQLPVFFGFQKKMLSTAAHFPTLTYSKLQLRRDFPHISRGQIWREQIMATEIQTSQAFLLMVQKSG